MKANKTEQAYINARVTAHIERIAELQAEGMEYSAASTVTYDEIRDGKHGDRIDALIIEEEAKMSEIPLITPRSKRVASLLQRGRPFNLKVRRGMVFFVDSGGWCRERLDGGSFGKPVRARQVLEEQR